MLTDEELNVLLEQTGVCIGDNPYYGDVYAALTELRAARNVITKAAIHRNECYRIRILIEKMGNGDGEALSERREKGNQIGKTGKALDDALDKYNQALGITTQGG